MLELDDTDFRGTPETRFFSGHTMLVLRQSRNDFAEHVRRVDSATKLTQTQPDSQYKRAKAVLAQLDDAIQSLKSYGVNDASRS